MENVILKPGVVTVTNIREASVVEHGVACDRLVELSMLRVPSDVQQKFLNWDERVLVYQAAGIAAVLQDNQVYIGQEYPEIILLEQEDGSIEAVNK